MGLDHDRRDVKACESDLDREVQIRVRFRFKTNWGFFTVRLARKRIYEDSELIASQLPRVFWPEHDQANVINRHLVGFSCPDTR